MAVRYIVELTDEERNKLQEIISKPTLSNPYPEAI